METVLGIVICAILFALFGLARPRSCAGHCAGCTSACAGFERHDRHD
ncbi:MAG: hypothetical protein JJE39_03920 [Vicinamibacteria bacterium]|nr:hypothetical protein [Vicinamibacteria bacterium]